MEPIFRPGTFLLPQAEFLPGWPVIACDQFTSDRAFWARAEETAGQMSALRLILPEVYLEEQLGIPREIIMSFREKMLEDAE